MDIQLQQQIDNQRNYKVQSSCPVIHETPNKISVMKSAICIANIKNPIHLFGGLVVSFSNFSETVGSLLTGWVSSISLWVDAVGDASCDCAVITVTKSLASDDSLLACCLLAGSVDVMLLNTLEKDLCLNQAKNLQHII